MKSKNEPSADLNRRRFIGGAGISALAVSGVSMLAAEPSRANSAGLTDSKHPGFDYDVIIVGGGFAGVAAARDCRKNGYRTLLLEARNRLGGRTFTTDFDGENVELGGFWIHHTQPFVWAEKERYGLELEELPQSDIVRLNIDGEVIEPTPEQMLEAMAGWQEFTSVGREVVPRAWDLLYNRTAALEADRISCADVLAKSELSKFQKKFISAMVATMAQNTPEAMPFIEVLRWHQCGGGYYPTVMDSVARFSLKEGTSGLIARMMEDARPEVRLATPVKGVTDDGQKVLVTTQRGEHITAAAAIACLPMNTIAEIAFDPPLPGGVVEASKQRHLGQGFKLYMKVAGDLGNVLSVAESNAINYATTYKRTADYTILVGFGSAGSDLDIYDDEAVERSLRVLLPDAKLLSTISYDWNNDPYAKGTWCNYRIGWNEKYHDDFNRDLGRIFFGCSDHGEGWRGFIDGAIGGGIRAAQRVKELLG